MQRQRNKTINNITPMMKSSALITLKISNPGYDINMWNISTLIPNATSVIANISEAYERDQPVESGHSFLNLFTIFAVAYVGFACLAQYRMGSMRRLDAFIRPLIPDEIDKRRLILSQNIEKYELGRQLGQGLYGCVSEATTWIKLSDQKEVALVVAIKESRNGLFDYEICRREEKLIKRLNHSSGYSNSIVHCYTGFDGPLQRRWSIYEKCDGDLFNLIKNPNYVFSANRLCDLAQ